MDDPVSLKNVSLWILLIVVGILLAFIIFISLISINIGLNHMQQDGFWVPVLGGAFAIIICLWLFFVISRFIRNRMKEEDIIHNI